MNRFAKQFWRVVLMVMATAAVGLADATMPPPGTLNYVEGQVKLNGAIQSPNSAGSSTLAPGQVLSTHDGNAELLLTPGVYLRVGYNSQVQMISPDLTNTAVRLLKGSAMVEVDDLYKENHIGMQVGGATVTLQKKGLYAFDAAEPSASVLDGKAQVARGGQQVSLKKGHQVMLAAGRHFAARKFDKDQLEATPLYAWSKLRSEYDSEANVQTADNLMLYGGWYGPGWYWDPYWSFWSFLPGDGILWGPFGWGFFSPGWVGYAPYYGYPRFYGGGRFPAHWGNRGRPAMRGFARGPHSMGYGRMGNSGARGGFHGGGIQRGLGGGFHGGSGGGFHGGGPRR